MDLQEYEQTKFSLADILRASLLLVPEEDREARQGLGALQARLAEDRFNLVFIGRFNRGKSSLMNALLGTDQLPTGIIPLTSVVTTVTYGSRKQLVIRYGRGGLDSTVSLTRLPEFVTQQGNPGNQKDVWVAEIQLPVELLRRGFFFVDTPGLGSSITANTQTTERFLPEADAFVLVTGYESPLSDDELRLLKQAVWSKKKVFIVLNKQDIAKESERDLVCRYIAEQLKTTFPDRSFEVFSTSAREGLLAKQTNDSTLFNSSGVASFEAELKRFMLEARQQEFLVQVCSRIRHFLASLDDSQPRDELFSRLADVTNGIDPSPNVSPGAVETITSEEIASWTPCEICERMHQASAEFLRVYQYQLVTDPKIRQEHAETGGFCSLHTWQYESIASPQGICTGYPPLLRLLSLQIIQKAKTLQTAGHLASQLLLPGQQCPLCRVSENAHQQAVVELSSLDQSMWSASRPSALCFPHLRDVALRMADPASASRLLRRAAALLQHVSEDMQRYAMKWDGIKRYLISEEERAAYIRALFLIAGKRSLAMSRSVK